MSVDDAGCVLDSTEDASTQKERDSEYAMGTTKSS